jgi:putative ABC transport system permease protein
LVDLFDEAVSSLLARPSRVALTSLGATLGIGALIATLGIAETAGQQVISRFDELESTEVVAYPAADSSPEGGAPESGLPLGADVRLERLNGVVAAGSFSPLDVGTVSSVAGGAVDLPLPVIAASPGLLGAVRGQVRVGRWFDVFHDGRGAPVVVLGPSAAAQLAITRLDAQPAVLVGGQPMLVIGILEDVARAPELLEAVIVPEGTAAGQFGLTAPQRVIVDASLGASELIASQIPIALSPASPELVEVRTSGGLGGAQGRAQSDIDALFVLLGAIALAVGALGIANATLVSVFERTGEIGLRRALGGTRRLITAQFLLESSLTGLVGGMVGMAGGVLVVVGAAAQRSWTPILDIRLAVAGPALGVIVGFVAGTYPAMRAGRIEPAEAVRRTQM